MWLVFGGNNYNFLGAAGIIIDIIGAAVLARGLFNRNDSIISLTQTYWGANPALKRHYCEQRLDATCGLTFLKIGFFLQLISAMGVQVGGYLALFIILFTILILIYYLHNFKHWSSARALELEMEIGAKEILRHHYSEFSEREWESMWQNRWHLRDGNDAA